ncbi:MAG: arsenate reductase family protein [Gemmatimonadota bacterium]
MNIQIFGTKKSKETRAALRFFADRRIPVHFVDFAVKGPSKGELSRFVQKFGVTSLVDESSKRYAELGLRAAHLSDERWMDTLVEEPLLLRQPLVRNQSQLTVGDASGEWKRWVEAAKG